MRLAWLLLTWLSISLGAVHAQEPPKQETSAAKTFDDALDPAAVRAKQKQIEEDPELTSEEKQAILREYSRALDRLAEAERADKRRQQFEEELSNLQDKLEKLRRSEPVDPSAEAQLDPSIEKQSLPEVQKLLESARAELQIQSQAVSSLDSAIESFSKRNPTQELAAEREKLEARVQDLQNFTPSDDAPRLNEAQRLRLQTRQLASEREIAALEAEIRGGSAHAQLLTAEREAAARAQQRMERRVQDLQGLVDRKNSQAAADAEKAAREEEQRKQDEPILKGIAEENTRTAARATELAEAIERANRRQERLGEQLKALERSYVDTQRRIQAVGLSETIGAALRRQLQELRQDEGLGEFSFEADDFDTSEEIAQLQLERIELEEKRDALESGAVLREELAELRSQEERDRLRDEIDKLLTARLAHVRSVLRNLDSYTTSLIGQRSLATRYIVLQQRFIDYLNEHVLWIQSGPGLWAEDWSALGNRLAEILLDARPARSAAQKLLRDIDQAGVLYVGLALFLLVLLLLRRRARTLLVSTGQTASKSLTVSMRPTWRALLYTFLLSFNIAPAIAFIGWRLMRGSPEGTFPLALGRGLLGTAIVIWLGEMVRQTCRPQGLAESHFDWSKEQVAALRKQSRWLLPFWGFTLLALGSLGSPTTSVGSHAVGRLILVIALPSLVLAWIRLRKTRLAVGAAPVGRLAILRGSWFYVFPLVLTVLWGLALTGYYYTAIQLFGRAFVTMLYVSPLVFAHSVGLRWLLLSRRKLRITQARERREKGEEAEATQVDPREISEQSGQLIKLFVVGIGVFLAWLVWSDLLPALNIFQEVPLWTDTETVNESFLDEDGQERINTYEKPIAITLWHAMLSMTVLGLTFFSARKLPSLIEVAVLQPMKVAPGERYAFRTLTFYAVTATGMALAFTTIGFGWSKIQWIVAAVSVGLGFGLQEIFANFVSGLILLFERPLRVGDIVTVGSLDGRVTRIQIRATTITDWDRRELVVPNKEFITNQLVNWTLTDTVTRATILVGVAYGSDTDRTTALLQQIAYGNKWVLHDPAPVAVFWAFGDSSLTFRLLIHIPNRDCVLELFHQLNTRIHQEFKKAGIEIAFPQRDLHLRSAGPLLELFRRGESEPVAKLPVDTSGKPLTESE
ncbi:MAG: mechanosensitive ion channel [Planctomycetota bacterium]